jgi:photosystem II stability/assembly factor-like uncharacterized protein
MRRRTFVAAAVLAPAVHAQTGPGYVWRKLDTVAFRGKQDDIHFIDPRRGWYVNGSGKIYRTRDGGASWVEVLSQPGTYFRTVGFVDENIGLAGNVGTDYYPGVTDATPLYRTTDGGASWRAVTEIKGPVVKGLCAIDVQPGAPGATIWAGGRVGGPAFLMKSEDAGATWVARDLSALTGMILDVRFVDARRGFICGATTVDSAKSSALILRTDDGGASWQPVFRSPRPFEITWKCAFPTREVGYVSIQSYDSDPDKRQRYVAKTTDGGASWIELPTIEEHKYRAFGIGFATPELGWIGGTTTGLQTTDGGKTWTKADMGPFVNKVRVLKTERGFIGYAIGAEVRKLEWS